MKLTVLVFISFGWTITPNYTGIPAKPVSTVNSLTHRAEKFDFYAQDIFDCLGEEDLTFEAFYNGLKSYESLKNKGKLKRLNQLVVIDFSLPSNKERFFVIDLTEHTIVYKKLVAHGRKTGDVYAKRFSNIEQSHQSSIGTYVTGNTYNGKYDNSLLIHGQEYTNSNARKRGVVIHSAKYATRAYMEKNGRLGRSFGCPALPFDEYELVIDHIKEGTALFIYANDKRYLSKSKFLKRNLYLKNFF